METTIKKDDVIIISNRRLNPYFCGSWFLRKHMVVGIQSCEKNNNIKPSSAVLNKKDMETIKEGKYTQEEYTNLYKNHPELWGGSKLYMYPEHMVVGIQSCEKCERCMQPELCASSLYIVKIVKKEL